MGLIHTLAADVGGTNARLAWVEVDASGASAPMVLSAQAYRCADFSGLPAIIERFLVEHPGRPAALALACAGLRHGREVINRNLPWRLMLDPLEALAGDAPLHLSNDFEALARATRWVAADAGQSLFEGAGAATRAPVLVLGPGTGLGAALRVPVGQGEVVVPTEGGQAGFAPATDLESAVLDLLRDELGHVCTESVLSGPGLLRLYRALALLRDQPAALDTPEAVGSAALAGDEDLAVEAVRVFWGALASVCGNSVLGLGAYGGVLLAGGILPRLMPLFDAQAFARRFCDKGGLSPVLAQVPVRLIEHGQLGIVGAAMAASTRV
ncbi:MAG: glucokinase [Xanthomonadales bacterium]|nr:glucokinase [Xanthomonadales bacterium]